MISVSTIVVVSPELVIGRDTSVLTLKFMTPWADSHAKEPAHCPADANWPRSRSSTSNRISSRGLLNRYPGLRPGRAGPHHLGSAEGLTNAAVAKRVGVTPHTVGKWRRRFREAGIQGLHDEIRSGRPRTYDDDKVASVINRALQETPDTGTHWSTRVLGQAAGLSKSTVQRWLALFGVKPHLARTFKLSTDPFFIEKVRDIVGLYLNPPDHSTAFA